MKKLLMAFAAIIITLVAVADERLYVELLDRADRAVARQDWTEAEKYLREAMQTEPSNPANVTLLSNCGMFQFYRGEDSLALHTLSEARAIAPTSPVILRNRAKVLRHMGRIADALKDYDLLVKIDSTNYDTYFDRGSMLLLSGDTVAAASDFAVMERLRPDDPNTLMSLGVLYANTGRLDDALTYYNRLIKTTDSPDTKVPAEKRAKYYTARAMVRLVKEDMTDASADIARGLELDPESGELYFCRANLKLLQYQDADAKADAEKARSLGVPQERIDELFQSVSSK